MTPSAPLHACTTATRAQLPAARVLCESLRRHHPDAEITLLVVDDVDGAEREPPGVRLVSPSAIGVPGDVLSRLATAVHCDRARRRARASPRAGADRGRCPRSGGVRSRHRDLRPTARPRRPRRRTRDRPDLPARRAAPRRRPPAHARRLRGRGVHRIRVRRRRPERGAVPRLVVRAGGACRARARRRRAVGPLDRAGPGAVPVPPAARSGMRSVDLEPAHARRPRHERRLRRLGEPAALVPLRRVLAARAAPALGKARAPADPPRRAPRAGAALRRARRPPPRRGIRRRRARVRIRGSARRQGDRRPHAQDVRRCAAGREPGRRSGAAVAVRRRRPRRLRGLGRRDDRAADRPAGLALPRAGVARGRNDPETVSVAGRGGCRGVPRLDPHGGSPRPRHPRLGRPVRGRRARAHEAPVAGTADRAMVTRASTSSAT